MATAAQGQDREIETDIPQRLDRCRGRVGTPHLTALGTSWILDGLEVTLVGSLSGILESEQGLHLSDAQVTGSADLLPGRALWRGRLLFGYLTDRLGRRKLFLVTLATYSLATVASAFSWNILSFASSGSLLGWGSGGNTPRSTRRWMN